MIRKSFFGALKAPCLADVIFTSIQAKYWKQYVEAHMAVNNDDATKQIFSRCLLNCLQIPLWYVYFDDIFWVWIFFFCCPCFFSSVNLFQFSHFGVGWVWHLGVSGMFHPFASLCHLVWIGSNMNDFDGLEKLLWRFKSSLFQFFIVEVQKLFQPVLTVLYLFSLPRKAHTTMSKCFCMFTCFGYLMLHILS